MPRSVMVGLLRNIRLEEVEERLTTVLARLNGLGSASLGLSL